MVFTTAQKVTKHLGYFINKICCQEILKIAQSGHTSQMSTEIKLAARITSFPTDHYRLRASGQSRVS